MVLERSFYFLEFLARENLAMAKRSFFICFVIFTSTCGLIFCLPVCCGVFAYKEKRVHFKDCFFLFVRGAMLSFFTPFGVF